MKAPSPIALTLSGMDMPFRLEHSQKALSPISVSFLGKVTLVKPVQPEKAPVIFVTFSGMDTLVRLEHSEKAQFPIVVTLSGMVIFFRLEHPQKALSPILVSFLGKVTLAKLVQPSKVLSVMLVTLSGIVMLPKLTHPEKEPSDKAVTLLGMETLVKFAQPSKIPHLKSVMPSPIITLFISVLLAKGDRAVGQNVGPLPVSVRLPSSSSVHVMESPHLPDDAAKALSHNSITAKSAIVKIVILCFIVNEYINYLVFQIPLLYCLTLDHQRSLFALWNGSTANRYVEILSKVR